MQSGVEVLTMDDQTSRPSSIVDHLLARAEGGDVRALLLLARYLLQADEKPAAT